MNIAYETQAQMNYVNNTGSGVEFDSVSNVDIVSQRFFLRVWYTDNSEMYSAPTRRSLTLDLPFSIFYCGGELEPKVFFLDYFVGLRKEEKSKVLGALKDEVAKAVEREDAELEYVPMTHEEVEALKEL